MISTITDVEKTLSNARELEEYWKDYGWESLEIEEETMSDEILDIYPLVEVDISVNITIKLPNTTYTVPLEDISPLNTNDCLVIGVNDLYSDWEERIWNKVEEGKLIHHLLSFPEEGEGEIHTRKFLGLDHRLRVVKQTIY